MSALLIGACSSGRLDEERDRHLSVYGLPLTEPGPHQGAFLGRAVMEGGEPAAWAQVYARSKTAGPESRPLVTLTNAKGGFFLGRLEPGDYRIFVLSPAGQGLDLSTHVGPGEVQERADIALAPLTRVTGTARLEGEPAHGGITVYAPETPFSTTTDHAGYFFLDVPRGTYTLRAEKDGFQRHETAALDVQADVGLDVTLAPNPWPDGEVRLEGSDDQFLVRGLVTTVRIRPVPGVRYMRASLVEYRGRAKSPLLGQWQPVAETVAVEHDGPGLATLSVEFMDAFGKKSDPVGVAYYNTTLDASWRLFYGTVTAPVTLRAGEKAALLDLRHGGNTGSQPAPAPIGSSGGPVPGFQKVVLIRGPGGERSINVKPHFLQAVTVEAGATLVGGGTFHGPLTITGTAAQPVRWTLGDESGQVFGQAEIVRADAALRHVDITNGELSALDAGTVRIADAVLTNVVVLAALREQDPGSSTLDVDLEHVRLAGGQLRLDCSGDKLLKDPPEEALTTLRLALRSSQVEGASLALDCRNDPGRIAAALTLTHSDFLDTDAGGYYLYAVPALDDPGVGLPSKERLTYSVTDDHFRYPGRLHAEVGRTGWPEAFGPNVPAPRTDVGPRRP